jgi:hypothetical protein
MIEGSKAYSKGKNIGQQRTKPKMVEGSRVYLKGKKVGR